MTRAQHCRAEFFAKGFGWVPVDPADVRKVVLEEPPGNLAVNDEKVVAARKRLFGSWEMNWLAYTWPFCCPCGRARPPVPVRCVDSG